MVQAERDPELIQEALNLCFECLSAEIRRFGGQTVTGDAVNVAARLEKAAERGAVLIGESTRRLARRRFLWGDRQELTVKGRMEPAVCYTVEELRAAP